jgi:hypothetical protein
VDGSHAVTNGAGWRGEFEGSGTGAVPATSLWVDGPTGGWLERVVVLVEPTNSHLTFIRVSSQSDADRIVAANATASRRP